jgi:hypothetical protein
MATNLIDQHKNLNGIQVSECYDFGEGVVEAGNTVIPGNGVAKGAAAGEVVHATTAAACVGIALENQRVNVGGDPITLRTAFAAGERVRYGRDPGFKFMARIASGENLAKGAYLTPGAAGWVGGTDATDSCARLIQEGGTGGALGAAGYFLAKWGVDA